MGRMYRGRKSSKTSNHRIRGLKASGLSPLHFKLQTIRDTPASCFHEKCYSRNCWRSRVYCALPCGHFGLCERCMQVKSDNDCKKCGIEAKDWIKLREVETEESPTTCVICFDQVKDVAFLPCGHFAACNECSLAIMMSNSGEVRCPICRAAIAEETQVYPV